MVELRVKSASNQLNFQTKNPTINQNNLITLDHEIYTKKPLTGFNLVWAMQEKGQPTLIVLIKTSNQHIQ